MVAVPGRHRFLLEVDLTSVPLELEPEDPIGRLRARHRPRLRGILRALHEGGADPRVRGVLIKIGEALDWALAQEVRAAVRAFAASGKPVVGWAETLGEGGNAAPDYLLASGCSEIWLQPTGDLRLLGVAAETTFLRGALDKLGIEPQLDKRYEYKSAADRVMNTEFTDAHREAIDAVLSSVWSTAVNAIATARGIGAERVRELAGQSPLDARAALEAGLIDRIGYRDEVYADLKRRVGDDVELLFADRWSPQRKPQNLVRRSKDFVARVDAYGEIHIGRSRGGPGAVRMGSDTVAAALRAARRNDHARAVVLRVDSPGGSAVASDVIWREVVLTRDAGKPVIVSMGSVAGSGGYYVACPGDVIIAEPGTITGSIGVLGGKMVITGLLDKLGLTTGAVAYGDNARMFSARTGFTEAQRERLGALLDRIYQDFVQKVADGRGMTYDAVHAVAKGRIWSGADAHERGLVDRLGGLVDAYDLARERVGLRADAPVRPAVHVPPLARLGRAASSEDPRALAGTSTLGDWGDLAGLAAAIGLPAAGPLRMPGISLR